MYDPHNQQGSGGPEIHKPTASWLAGLGALLIVPYCWKFLGLNSLTVTVLTELYSASTAGWLSEVVHWSLYPIAFYWLRQSIMWAMTMAAVGGAMRVAGV